MGKDKVTVQNVVFAVMLPIIVIICLAAGYVVGVTSPPSKVFSPVVAESKIDMTVVKQTLEASSDLVTQKYVYTDAIYDEDCLHFIVDLPFTTRRMGFTYKGVISAGYDLSKTGIRVNEKDKQLILTLPELKIVAHEIDEDSYQYTVQEESIFNSYTPEDMTELQKKLKKRMVKSAEQDEEFKASAEENARTVLTNFLQSSGITEGYEIIIK